jgi:hypothetical protein
MFPLMKLTDVMQQKWDGTLTAVFIDLGADTFFWTNNGTTPHKFAAAMLKFPALEAELKMFVDKTAYPHNELVLIGELIIETGEYKVFDLFTSSDEVALAGNQLWTRLRRLETLRRRLLDSGCKLIEVTYTACSTSEKQALWSCIKAAGVEGAVSKHLESVYVPGTRTTQWVKHKLVKSAEAVVTKAARIFKPDSTVVKEGKAELSVYRDGKLVRIGSASLIGKDLTIEAGDVVEFEYLYFTGSSPVQPRITRKRFDKDPMDCDFSQFPEYSRREVRP